VEPSALVEVQAAEADQALAEVRAAEADQALVEAISLALAANLADASACKPNLTTAKSRTLVRLFLWDKN
jgi:hypothetical protein